MTPDVAPSRVGDSTNSTMMVTHPLLHGQPSPALTTPNVVYKQVFVYMQPPQQHQEKIEV